MTEGRYTISEIDRMRKAIRTKLDFLWVTDVDEASNYPEDGRLAQVEELLRTHMLNGTPVEELERDAASSVIAHDAIVARRHM